MIAFKGQIKRPFIKYKVGEIYNYNGTSTGFCSRLEDIDLYYSLSNKNTEVLKVEILGNIIFENDTIFMTNKFKVLEIIPPEDYPKYYYNLNKDKSEKLKIHELWKEES